MSRSFRRSRSCSAFRPPAWLVCAVLAACAGTETDNPVSSGSHEPPRGYESPTDFNPGEVSPPGCLPPDDVGMPRRLPLWGRDGALVIGADRYGGLRVIDASDALQPRVASQLALAGEPRALLVAPGSQLTLAIDELPELQQTDVPEPRALEPVTRLVRYDASDPSAPQRLADVELEGELWRVVQHGALTWVMSAKLAKTELSCDRTPLDCGSVDRVALILTGYRFADGTWSQAQRVQLPLRGPAWATPEGFASFEATADAEANASGGVIHAVRFEDDDRLGAEVALASPLAAAMPAPISLADGHARVFLRDLRDGDVQLAVYDLASGEQLGVVGGLPQPGRVAEPIAAGVLVGDESAQQGAVFIDTREPSEPRVVPLPAPTAQVWPLDAQGSRLLGIGPAAGGALQAQLVQLQDGVPTVLDQQQIPRAVAAPEHDRLWLAGDHVLFDYRVQFEDFSTQAPRLGGFAIGEDSLTWRDLGVDSYADELVALEGAVYAPDAYGLAVAPLAPGAPAGTRLDWTEEISAYVAAGDYEAALVRHLRGPLTLELTRGEQRISFEVSPGARRLTADDERVLVISTEPRDQCAQIGLDCTDYSPNVAIFTLADSPAPIAELPLPDADLIANDPDAQVRLDWEAERDPLALGHGRYVFVAELDASCTQPEACEALGIEAVPIAQANVNIAAKGTPDCPPNADRCEPEAPPPAPTVYGTKRAQRFYLIDSAASAPRWSPAAESVLELDDSRFAPPRVSHGVLLATRLERARRVLTPGVASAPPSAARFMLDRFELGDDEELHALPPVNVPGYPLALQADATVLVTAEPDSAHEQAAIVHRLALRDDGAHALQSLSLPARFGAVDVEGQRVIYLQRQGEGCNATTTVTVIPLPADDQAPLRAQEGLALAGGAWTIADTQGDRLLLTAASRQYAVIALDGAAPRLQQFTSVARYMDQPRLAGDTILGAGALWGRQRIEL